jgi:hypothetical protein
MQNYPNLPKKSPNNLPQKSMQLRSIYVKISACLDGLRASVLFNDTLGIFLYAPICVAFQSNSLRVMTKDENFSTFLDKNLHLLIIQCKGCQTICMQNYPKLPKNHPITTLEINAAKKHLGFNIWLPWWFEGISST